jgi:electron transfer flavoprotein alpha/beta subunit
MLHIIVCIKQVPETQEVRLDPVTHTLKREDCGHHQSL